MVLPQTKYIQPGSKVTICVHTFTVGLDATYQTDSSWARGWQSSISPGGADPCPSITTNDTVLFSFHLPHLKQKTNHTPVLKFHYLWNASAGLYASYLKVQGQQGILSLVKGTLWGNCRFLLWHFKGTKAMTRGHWGNRLSWVKYQACCIIIKG